MFDLVPRPMRRTLEITVERDGGLSIKVPNGVTADQVRNHILAKQDWVHRKLAEKDAMAGTHAVKELVNGEGFAYLGRSYRLLLVGAQDAVVKLHRGRLQLHKDTLPAGRSAIRAWYTGVGQAWLQQRVIPWASRGGTPGIEIWVGDLGYRWGSTRGDERINIHWATLQMRPSLIDYILVHELAHLHEPDHGPSFWRRVEKVMPDYEPRKKELAIQGAHLWLGALKTP